MTNEQCNTHRTMFAIRMTDSRASANLVSFLCVGKCRLEIFRKACLKFGLTVVDHHVGQALILIDDELDFLSACQALKSSSSSVTFVRTQWLSDSIKKNELLSHQSYILRATLPTKVTPVLSEQPAPAPPEKRERSVSSSASDTDDERSSKKVTSRRDPLEMDHRAYFSPCSMSNRFNPENCHAR